LGIGSGVGRDTRRASGDTISQGRNSVLLTMATSIGAHFNNPKTTNLLRKCSNISRVVPPEVPVSKASLRFSLSVLFSSLLLLSVNALADSHVRIVRLSYIEGGVQIDRNTGQYEKAIVNLPITEGAKLRTDADGRAEVEFEDGSTLRLAPRTTVQFPQLSLRDSGAKISGVDVQSGTVYVGSAGSKGNELTLQFGREKLSLTESAHLRIGTDEQATTVAVFKGDVQVEGPSADVRIKKNQTASFASADAQPTLAKQIEPEPLDSWDKQQAQYQQRYASNSYTNYSPYRYGTTDMAYYGNFFSAPGYGMLWQPYFVDASWSPFMDGAWAFSPGFGYGWVSSYPWGWTPYHSGSWLFLPGYGWAWQPGGAWMPWYSQPQLLRTPAGFKPPQAPTTTATKGTTIVTVSRGAVSSFVPRGGNKVEIRNNSAGLGVPRGQISNLAKVSNEVQQRGAVTQRVHPAPVAQVAPRGESRPSSTVSEPRSAPRSSPPPMSAPAPHMSSPPPSSPHGSPHK
jgi:hypothetical protein